jgi:hypothetical protein
MVETKAWELASTLAKALVLPKHFFTHAGYPDRYAPSVQARGYAFGDVH